MIKHAVVTLQGIYMYAYIVNKIMLRCIMVKGKREIVSPILFFMICR